MTTLDAVFRSALKTRGPDPFLTYYDLASGERTELSLVSFTNWVDKTANLLVNEYALEEGDKVALTLAGQAPGHWVTLIWATAIWQAGGEVVLDPAAGSTTGGDVVLEVIGPDLAPLSGADAVLACSLHPLGLGFADPLPDGIADYGLEARAQPDSHLVVDVDPAAPVWLDHDSRLGRTEMLDLAGAQPGGRRLLRPDGEAGQGLRMFIGAVLGSLVNAGSAVVVIGDGTDDRLSRILATERTS